MAPWNRATGPGFKPPRAAVVKSHGSERRRKRCYIKHQVGNRKTNESELLMTCRKAIQPTSKPSSVIGSGGAQTIPVYGLSGVRHGGSVILFQASGRNVGTCHSNVKGEIRVGSPHEKESTNVEYRGGAVCSSDEIPEKVWSEGAASSSWIYESTHMGRSW